MYVLSCSYSNQSILKEISPEYSLEGLMLRLKLQYFDHLMWRTDSSSPSPPAPNPSQHQGLSNESALCIRWSKYWSFSFNISPSNEHSGLISFRMDWLDLFVVQGISILSSCNSRKGAPGHGMKEKLKYSWPSNDVGLGAVDPLHGQN